MSSTVNYYLMSLILISFPFIILTALGTRKQVINHFLAVLDSFSVGLSKNHLARNRSRVIDGLNPRLQIHERWMHQIFEKEKHLEELEVEDEGKDHELCPAIILWGYHNPVCQRIKSVGQEHPSHQKERPAKKSRKCWRLKKNSWKNWKTFGQENFKLKKVKTEEWKVAQGLIVRPLASW